MAFTEKITLMVDVVTGNAKGQFKTLSSDIKNTDGAFNKMKVGAKGAFDTIGAMGPQVALAAGAALVGFAAKGVSAFQKTALAAGEMADATGLTVEQSSKWIEVADHIDVSEGAVSSAFRRMSIAIGKNSDGWKDLGIEQAKNADGSINLSETFLRVVDSLNAMKNPTERAAAAQKLFGKGYAEVAELIGKDASKLREELEDVGEAKIIDEAELAKARKFRGAMDDLGDAVQEVGIALGETLVPALTDLAELGTEGIEIAVNVKSDFEKVDEQTGGWLGRIASQVNQTLNPIERLKTSVNTLKDAFGVESTAATAAATATSSVADSKNRAWVATNNLTIAENTAIATTAGMVAAKDRERAANAATAAAIVAANDALSANINLQLAAVDSAFAVTNATNNWLTALQAANSATDDSSTAVNEQQMALDGATQAAIATAVATDEYARKQAEAEGATYSAKDSQQTLINTLMTLAGQAGGPTAAAIGEVITKLQTVGAQHPNPTISANDQATGKINNVQASLNNLNGKSATVALDAIFRGGAAMSEANRFLSIARQANAAAATLPSRQAGGPIPGGKSQGVPIMAHGGEYVLSADVVDRIKRGATSEGASVAGGGAFTAGRSGGGGSLNIHFHGPVLGTKAEFGRYIEEAVAESRRRGNRVA